MCPAVFSAVETRNCGEKKIHLQQRSTFTRKRTQDTAHGLSGKGHLHALPAIASCGSACPTRL